jgi:hypothetical protein
MGSHFVPRESREEAMMAAAGVFSGSVLVWLACTALLFSAVLLLALIGWVGLRFCCWFQLLFTCAMLGPASVVFVCADSHSLEWVCHFGVDAGVCVCFVKRISLRHYSFGLFILILGGF